MKYAIQATQTAGNNASILLGRSDTLPFTQWPKLSIKTALPSKNQTYRTANVVFTQPFVQLVDGASVSLSNYIGDLTVKLPKEATDAEISAFATEFLKVVNHSTIVTAIKTQVRVSADITTA